ncbi:MAG: redox-regulated ATPase YchF [Bdellovibrionales bacterium]|nr:redox-regulated ATPase YchF [Bdellovibrionales bacterium]
MGLKCGIVGLPNVGKSTLFNAVSTTAKAQAANYPFCTIDPNVGVVEVPDARLKIISDYVKPKKLVPTHFEFVDIAGLVKGASKGEGLGNQFLGHIKDCDAIAHVVRCFDDGDVVHVNGSVDPLRDVEIIDTELMLADLATVEKRLDRSAKAVKTGEKNAAATLSMLERIKKALESGQAARTVTATPEEWTLVHDLHLITQKPMLFIGNLDEASAGSGSEEGNSHYQKLKEYGKKVGAEVIPICAKVEAEVAELDPSERPSFLADLGIKTAGLDKVITAAYRLLGLRTYFTAGEQEVRAWTIHAGWKGPQAAGVIHSDFERGFICAETYHFDDLVKCGSTQKVKEAGLLRTEGKEYVVKDGDILLFRFNV